MRIIIKIDELLQNEDYKKLSKEETDSLFAITSLFAEEDKQELPLSFIQEKIAISDDFKEKTSFCLYYGKIVKITKFFTWFKSNKTYVAKSRKRESHKEVIETETKETKKVDTIDYERIRLSFNEAFKDTKLKNKVVREITDERKKLIKSLYNKNSKKLENVSNIYDFYEDYWELIKTIGDKHHNHIKGWKWAEKKDGWNHPDFDYFIKGKPFAQIEVTIKEHLNN